MGPFGTGDGASSSVTGIFPGVSLIFGRKVDLSDCSYAARDVHLYHHGRLGRRSRLALRCGRHGSRFAGQYCCRHHDGRDGRASRTLEPRSSVEQVDAEQEDASELLLQLDRGLRQWVVFPCDKARADLGRSADVFLIDTGMYTSHQDISGRSKFLKTFGKYGPADKNGHGTFVASLAGGAKYVRCRWLHSVWAQSVVGRRKACSTFGDQSSGGRWPRICL
jgi:hypothetical protein